MPVELPENPGRGVLSNGDESEGGERGMTRETRGMATRILFSRRDDACSRMSEHPTDRRGRCLLLGEMPSGVGYCRGWGRATLETEEGPRTSSDPLLPNPFSLPEMTERVKNNGSGGAAGAAVVFRSFDTQASGECQ